MPRRRVEGGARPRPHPHRQRRDRRRGRHRGRGVRPRPGGSCRTCPPASTSCRPAAAPTTTPSRREETLASIVPRDPRRVYKMRDLIGAVVDRGSFFEIGRGWGKSIITGLARLDGWPVARLRRGPLRLRRRVDRRCVPQADPLHRPGLAPSTCRSCTSRTAPASSSASSPRRRRTIRLGSTALAALGQSTSPFCCVVVRKAFGVAGGRQPQAGRHPLPRSPGRRATGARCRSRAASRSPTRPSWPTPTASPRGRGRRSEQRLNRVRSAPTARRSSSTIEEIIDPRDTRPMLCRWANLVAPTRAARPGDLVVPPLSAREMPDGDGAGGAGPRHRLRTSGATPIMT